MHGLLHFSESNLVFTDSCSEKEVHVSAKTALEPRLNCVRTERSNGGCYAHWKADLVPLTLDVPFYKE